MPLADPPNLDQMVTEALAGAVATPFKGHVDTAPAYWMAGILWSVLAEGRTTDGSYVLFEELCPKGAGAPPHLHIYTDEVFYVLDGEAEFLTGGGGNWCSGDRSSSSPGEWSMRFAFAETARFLNLYSQAGFERIIALTGKRPSSGSSRLATSRRRRSTRHGVLSFSQNSACKRSIYPIRSDNHQSAIGRPATLPTGRSRSTSKGVLPPVFRRIDRGLQRAPGSIFRPKVSRTPRVISAPPPPVAHGHSGPRRTNRAFSVERISHGSVLFNSDAR